mgnify:FL=1
MKLINTLLTAGLVALLANNALAKEKPLQQKPPVCETISPEYNCNLKDLAENQHQFYEAVCRSNGRNTPVLIMDKAAEEMTLYIQGKPVKTYQTALSCTPHKKKLYDGDGNTPEGHYFTEFNPYTQAIQLKFPNWNDSDSFIDTKQEGSLPKQATQGLERIAVRSGPNSSCSEGDLILSKEDLKHLLEKLGPDKKSEILILDYGTKESYL